MRSWINLLDRSEAAYGIEVADLAFKFEEVEDAARRRRRVLFVPSVQNSSHVALLLLRLLSTYKL